MAKNTIDLKKEATRSLYAVAGAADLAVVTVRELAEDLGKRVSGVQKDVEETVAAVSKTVSEIDGDAVREYATEVQGWVSEVQKDVEEAIESVSKTVSEIDGDKLADQITAAAKERREKIEARVAELRGDAKGLPGKVQSLLDENVAGAAAAYAELVKRGEVVVARVFGEEQTAEEAVKAAVKAPAKKAPAKKAPVKKAPAKKAVAKKAPAKKAPAPAAKKAPAKKAPAKKAPVAAPVAKAAEPVAEPVAKAADTKVVD